MCRFSWNLGASPSWNPSRPVHACNGIALTFSSSQSCLIYLSSTLCNLSHKHNLANNTVRKGGGNSQGMSFFVKAWLGWGYSASCKTQVFNFFFFFFFCFLHTTQKKSLFLFAPPQLNSRKKLCVEKILEWHFSPYTPLPPRSYAYDLSHSIAKIFSCLFSGGKFS